MKRIFKWLRMLMKCKHARMKSVWFDKHYGIETLICKNCGHVIHMKLKKTGNAENRSKRVRKKNNL